MLGQYLAELEWPAEDAPGAEIGMTWHEMAIDFEVATGHDLPPPPRVLLLGDAALRAKGRATEADLARACEAFVVDAQQAAARAYIDTASVADMASPPANTAARVRAPCREQLDN